MVVIRCMLIVSSLVLWHVSSGQSSLKLTKSTWKSRYFHYQNNYRFLTDSTGMVTRDSHVGDSIFHTSMDITFSYTLIEDTLTIVCDSCVSKEPDTYVKSKDDEQQEVIFISTFQYTYGREWLYKKEEE